MITVHHLGFSRSIRIIWLLEELDLPYALVRYERDAQFKAPASLRDVHPLGKAPVIQDGDLVLAESAAILAYINTRYGDGRFAPPAGSGLDALHDEWLQYVESTAALPIMMLRIGDLAGGLPEKLKQFLAPTLAKTLDYIASAVTAGDYLMGAQFTLADIQMSYVLEMAHHGRLLTDYPALVAYLDRLKARPGFAKALAIGGPMAPPT
jgi:glutathione S-transferase